MKKPDELLREFATKYYTNDAFIDEMVSDLNALLDKLMPTEQRYTAKDIDMAYIIGAFNSAKLDGLGDELKRLKELKKQPHDIVDEIRSRMKGDDEEDEHPTNLEKFNGNYLPDPE